MTPQVQAHIGIQQTTRQIPGPQYPTFLKTLGMRAAPWRNAVHRCLVFGPVAAAKV
jgi:hypothetical protein